MNKKRVILCVIIGVLILGSIVFFMKRKSIIPSNEQENVGDTNAGEVVEEFDYDNVEVSTIKFKIKNSTKKDIDKIYIRDNTEENFANELVGVIKDGEEKQVEYGKYASIYLWDFKVAFKDGMEKTLNTQIAANVLYDGATIELVDSEDTVEAINHDMKPVEEITSENTDEEMIDEDENTETDEKEEIEKKDEISDVTNHIDQIVVEPNTKENSESKE